MTSKMRLSQVSINTLAHWLRGKDAKAQLVKGTGEALVVKGSSLFVSFALTILLSNTMGAEGYGVYAYVFSWINLLIILGRFGFDSVLVRYVAAYQAKHNWGAFSGIMRRSKQIVFLCSFILWLLLCASLFFLQNRLGPALSVTFLVGAIVLLLEPQINLCQSILRALGHIALSNLPLMVIRPAIVVFIIAAAYFLFGFEITAHFGASIYLLASILALVLIFIILRMKIPETLHTETEAVYEVREWMNMAWPMLLSSASTILMNRTDVIMLGIFAGTTDAGIYHIVVRAASLTTIGLISVNSIAGPLIAKYYATYQKADLQRTVRLAAWGILALSLPVAVIFIFFGKSLLAVFGPQYIQGYTALVIMLAGQIVNALTGLVGLLMIMTAYQKPELLFNILASVLNIAMNLLLIPRYGIVGAAVATSLTLIAVNLLRVGFVYRNLNVNTTIFTFSRI